MAMQKIKRYLRRRFAKAKVFASVKEIKLQTVFRTKELALQRAFSSSLSMSWYGSLSFVMNL
jgi:hypothetical protein